MKNEDIISAYKNAKQRLLLLDYDGTLVGFSVDPMHAKPPAALLKTLAALTSDPQNTVVIVSGRDHVTLDAWLGHLPLGFAAEHGFFIKNPNDSWQEQSTETLHWKDAVLEIMEATVRTLPGARIEQKTSSLVWHYRGASAPAVAKMLPALTAQLQQAIIHLPAQLVPGHSVIEVRVNSVNKGQAAQRWLKRVQWDFILAAGDDTTDEDMFHALPPHAFSLKVGSGKTFAQRSVDSPQGIRDLLYCLLSSEG